jgi:hypothetical protein
MDTLVCSTICQQYRRLLVTLCTYTHYTPWRRLVPQQAGHSRQPSLPYTVASCVGKASCAALQTKPVVQRATTAAPSCCPCPTHPASNWSISCRFVCCVVRWAAAAAFNCKLPRGPVACTCVRQPESHATRALNRVNLQPSWCCSQACHTVASRLRSSNCNSLLQAAKPPWPLLSHQALTRKVLMAAS